MSGGVWDGEIVPLLLSAENYPHGATYRQRRRRLWVRRRVAVAPGSNTSRFERPSRRLALRGSASLYLCHGRHANPPEAMRVRWRDV